MDIRIKIHSLTISPEILRLIAEIDEFRGAWLALGKLAPEKLTALKRLATIESIGSSTRIEGSKLTDLEVEALLKNLSIKKFSTRDEQEVAGYSEVMNLIFQNYHIIPLSENYVKQLHAEVLKYSEKDDWHRGEYKKSPNHVEAFGPDGKSLGIVFETASPFETGFRMESLFLWTNEEFEKQKLHPLLVIAVFVVEFLAIHPFQDGNGRLSRILTTYLLLKNKYSYVPYFSLESLIEHSKEGYYLSLRQTQGSLKTETPDWQPWILFFLRSLKRHKQGLELKLEQEKLLISKLPDLSMKIFELVRTRGDLTVKEIVTLTNANRNTVKKHLNNLVENNYLEQNGKGKGTWYSQK